MQLERGKEYQDFLVERMARIGRFVSVFSSKSFQSRNESLQNIEIKFDSNMARTGNIYFEIAEKSNDRKGKMVPSGVFRGDSSTLWIGDYNEVFVFSINRLASLLNWIQSVDSLPTWAKIVNTKPPGYTNATSQGVLLSRQKVIGDKLFHEWFLLDSDIPRKGEILKAIK